MGSGESSTRCLSLALIKHYGSMCYQKGDNRIKGIPESLFTYALELE